MEFIKILEQAENEPVFNSRLILDPAKAKCSMRSAIWLAIPTRHTLVPFLKRKPTTHRLNIRQDYEKDSLTARKRM